MQGLAKDIRKVTIVGVGLLGGSIGLALRADDFDGELVGVGRRQSSLDEALEVGAVDSATLEPDKGVAGADLVILATPVGAFEKLLKLIKPALADGVIVTDVGSTKREVVRIGERVFGRGGPFIGSHPMAGSENRGPAFARADLFVGATCILTPTAQTPPAATRRTEAFWKTLGLRTLQMTPADHDKAVARVSHLPHVMAGLLAMLPDDADLDVAATGFHDATRMAGGDPAMWRDILMTNRQVMVSVAKALGKDLERFIRLLDRGDDVAIEKLFAAAKRRRDETIGQRLTDRRIAAE